MQYQLMRAVFHIPELCRHEKVNRELLDHRDRVAMVPHRHLPATSASLILRS